VGHGGSSAVLKIIVDRLSACTLWPKIAELQRKGVRVRENRKTIREEEIEEKNKKVGNRVK
jgi:hypothetical protein